MILLLDVACMGISGGVLQRAHELGMWTIFVPPSATHLLQPAHVGLFAGYKQYLRKLHHDAELEAASSVLPLRMWMRIVSESTAWIASQSCVPVFRKCGMFGDRENLLPPLNPLQDTMWNVLVLFHFQMKHTFAVAIQ